MAKDATSPQPAHMQIGIVVSRWNTVITDKLLDGCKQKLQELGVPENHIHTLQVPGSFELPLGAQQLAVTQPVHAVICLGCVIKGETRHDEYIAGAVSKGIMELGLRFHKPFVFGVLTTETREQAEARTGGKQGNKGSEAAETAVEMVRLGVSPKWEG